MPNEANLLANAVHVTSEANSAAGATRTLNEAKYEFRANAVHMLSAVNSAAGAICMPNEANLLVSAVHMPSAVCVVT